jgi:hypothetical protein
MSLPSEIIAANREAVFDSFQAATSENRRRHLRGDVTAGGMYIYPNQTSDAHNIVNMFYMDDRLVIGVKKKTKVGANGLMVAIATLMATHSDDDFVVNPENVRFITGMSNKKWEDELKKDVPTVFRDKIFHHGRLSEMNIVDIRDAIIFIDEIDSGSDDDQRLAGLLEASGILDINVMKMRNIRFLIISATNAREHYQALRWGEYYSEYKMTIPPNYIGHSDFLKRGIIEEYYAIRTIDDAIRWLKEDLINRYGNDYRVGIVRANSKGRDLIHTACTALKVDFRDHTSVDRIPDAEFKEIFETTRSRHSIIAVKGLYRRANLIPNEWKLKVGPIHELYATNPDANVQTQGLVGRMTGYWKDKIDGGHKTGPYRTSIKVIKQAILSYDDPSAANPFQSRNFKKDYEGKVQRNIPSLLHADNIGGLDAVDSPKYNDVDTVPEIFTISENDVEFLRKHETGESWDPYISQLLEMIERIRPGYLATIPKIDRPNVMEPNGAAREKIINRLVDANKKREQYNWNDGQFKTDTYKIYVDTVCSRLFVSVCYGSKRNVPDVMQVADIPVA